MWIILRFNGCALWAVVVLIMNCAEPVLTCHAVHAQALQRPQIRIVCIEPKPDISQESAYQREC